MQLEDKVQVIKGVGPELAKKFAKLGVKTIEDLLLYFPRAYSDFSDIQPIARIKPGKVSVRAKIKTVKGRYVRRGMHITEAIASDKTGSVRLIWFNQPYRETSLKHVTDYFISGEFALSHQRLSIMNPAVELASDYPVNTARIVPIYRETKDLNSHAIRKAIKSVLDLIRTLPETLPAWLLKENQLIAFSKAVESIHFPKDSEDLDNAKHRLGFEEVFQLTLASLLNKNELLKDETTPIEFNEELAKKFVSNLPFKLTNAQRKVVWQIYQDMQRVHPMNRLVEGDVGSGKTVVAAMAALMVMSQQYQVAFMAPTEVLAKQHAETLYRLLEPLGFGSRVSLLVGSLKSKQKLAAHARLRSGDVGLMVGTHALIQEGVDLHKLGLVIVDEQHRFGVEQRKTLHKKVGKTPHMLSMTATPIPRSLALTLFGELDVSILDELPGGRKVIKTKICSPNSRPQLYADIDKQLVAGRQVFIVCPLISESEVIQANAAEKTFEEISQKDFKHRRVGLLHGRMKPAEKDDVMQRFVSQELDILVSTTVIEVGVDVPNATVMLIEGADRFGLAQIHQLRGRVGRGDHQGYCYLMMSDSSPPSRRLRALESSSDGFKLAELDLELRGPGAIYGTLQHGALDLKIAKFTDTKLVAEARQAAQTFIDKGTRLNDFPQIKKRILKLRQVTYLN